MPRVEKSSLGQVVYSRDPLQPNRPTTIRSFLAAAKHMNRSI